MAWSRKTCLPGMPRLHPGSATPRKTITSTTALGLDTWSAPLPGVYDEGALRELLHAAANGNFGDLMRVKGIAQVRRGWVHFDLAGGQASVAAFAPRDGEQPRVMAIGQAIAAERLAEALAECRLVAGEGVVLWPRRHRAIFNHQDTKTRRSRGFTVV